MSSPVLKPVSELVSPDGQPIKKLKQKAGKRLCIYTPITWPFLYKKYFKSFLRLLHPVNILALKSLGIDDYFILTEESFPVCKNRNMAVLKAQKYEADLILFLDADMVHPHDILFRLAKHNVPIVSGLYFHQSPPHLPVIYQCKEGDVYSHFYNYPRYDPFEVDLIGMGCALVDIKVFDDISMPYFEYGSTRADGIVDITEDVPFCREARAKGYKIIVDPTIKCRHILITDVGEENFEAYMTQYKSYQSLLDQFGDGTDLPKDSGKERNKNDGSNDTV